MKLDIAFCLLTLMASSSTSCGLTRGKPPDYFYVGGQYISDGTGVHLFSNQMYVEHHSPAANATRKDHPLVFIHGQAQTGTNWLNTPDGRQGWAAYFLAQGYEVYIVDQPQRGRSPYVPGDGSLETFSAEYISMYFTSVKTFNLWPQAHLHTQWPGTGLMGDPIYDQFYASQVQFQNDSLTVSNLTQRAGAALLDRIGPSILITHSQAGPLGFLIADTRPSLVKAIVALEPQGPPFQDRVVKNGTAITRPWGLTNLPLAYYPPVADPAQDLPFFSVPPPAPGLTDCLLQEAGVGSLPRKLVNLAKVPMLVVTSEASYHAGYDYCTVEYLQQAGVDAEHLDLSAAGIHGNAHFFFMEKSNLDIAPLVEGWITNKTGCACGP